ncbi:complex III assembly factor LYRM7 [Prorops nasuta]|uniref:complex III assembly factor LYRM7 n=1 Tax=Prorops nasuta TaxID=863751 RepID=UPI0034CDC298
MNDKLRREVLQIFKKLHRTRQVTFKDDTASLEVVRKKINDEYRKYKDVKNQAAIEELHKLAEDVEHELRTRVIQVVQSETNSRYEIRVRPETTVDNALLPTECSQLKSETNRSKERDKTEND